MLHKIDCTLSDFSMIIVKRCMDEKPLGFNSNKNSNKIQRQITKGIWTLLYNYNY